MLCPCCHSERCHRSRRARFADYGVGLLGFRPWRCNICNHRFYAKTVAARFWPLAHCARCGNLNLQRISREYVLGAFAWLPRLARVPAFRCEPCRHRFFGPAKPQNFSLVPSLASRAKGIRNSFEVTCRRLHPRSPSLPWCRHSRRLDRTLRPALALDCAAG